MLLLFFNSLLADLPQSALAGVVIAAALSLMNFTALRKYWQVRQSSLLLSLVATLGVVALGVLEGIVVAIFLAVLHVLPAQLVAARRGARPHRRQRGLARASTSLPDAQEEPGVVVYRWEAPLFFANAGTFRQQIRRMVRARRTALDRAAVRGDHRHRRHRGRGARAARQRAQRRRASTSRSSRCAAGSRTSPAGYGLYDTLDRDHFYDTIDEAFAAIPGRGRRDRCRS